MPTGPNSPGLKNGSNKNVGVLEQKLQRPGVEIVNLGLIDSPERAMAAGHQCRRDDIDLLFLYVTTYALSSTVLPIVQRGARFPWWY